MKKIISLILTSSLLVSATFSFTSCEKALETKVYGQIVPESFFQTEADLKAALTGMMIYISGRGEGTDYGLWTSHWVAPRVYGLSMTDELYRQYSSWSRWTWTPSHGAEGNGPGRPEDNWAVWQFNQKVAKITALLEDFKNCPVAESNPELVEECLPCRQARSNYPSGASRCLCSRGGAGRQSPESNPAFSHLRSGSSLPSCGII